MSSKSMAGTQGTNGSAPGIQRLGHRRPMVDGVQEINCRGPANNLFGSVKSIVGAQDTNCWGAGNKLLGSRKSMAAVH